jgi:predicted O-methyltransferase YrrM
VISPSAQSWTYAQNLIGEDSILVEAKEKADQKNIKSIGSGGGAFLRFLASSNDASNVVEIGTGTGVSGVWLLRGMNPAGVLTSIDQDAQAQRIAKETFAKAGIEVNRTRLITGKALDVVSRLTDKAYDLILIAGDKLEYESLLAESTRLLRPGGILVFDNALNGDAVANPKQQDAETIAVRNVGEKIREDERFISVLVANSDGLLAAIYRPERAN